ncbi:MAG: MarR family winged helix-turn-helix transcriptional regulator, partial [Hyphomonadaceae bacterium]
MPAADLEAHLGYWLRRVSNHVSHAFARKLAARGVTVAEWALLRVLYERAPTAPSQAAREMGMTRGAITKLADRLIAKGLLARAADARDGRAQTLALTAKGAAFVPRLAALADQNEAECFAMLSEAERRTLERLLRKLSAEHGLSAV